MDVCVKLGDSTLNSGQIVKLWPAGPFLCTFVQYLVAFCSRPEAVSDVTSGRFVGPMVPDKRVKFRYPRLNHSREIPPDAVAVFDGFFLAITSHCKSLVMSYLVLL